MEDYYSTERISNSSLGWFKRSPKYYKLKLEREIEDEKKSYLELGKQIHMAVLEPNRFEKEFTHLEYETPTNPKQKEFCERFVESKRREKVNDKAYRIYKQVYSTTHKSDKQVSIESQALYKRLRNYIKFLKQSEHYRAVLPTSTWEKIQNIVKSLKDHKLANTLLFQDDYGVFDGGNRLVNNELPIYWEFPIDGGITVPCKSLLDRLIIDHNEKSIQLIDLKTAYNLSNFTKEFTDFNYERQLAFYWMAVAWMFKNDFPEADFWEYQKQTFIIAVQTAQIAECKIFTIRDELLTEGLEEIDRLINELFWHMDNDAWDYSKEYYMGDGAEELK